jgi:hypothetical protein
MAQSAGVETGVRDLRGMKLSELLRQDGELFADTLRLLINRIDQPNRSISGYNPQRLD